MAPDIGAVGPAFQNLLGEEAGSIVPEIAARAADPEAAVPEVVALAAVLGTAAPVVGLEIRQEVETCPQRELPNLAVRSSRLCPFPISTY